MNAYPDDHQVYFSHVDPGTLDACVVHNVRVTKQAVVPSQWDVT